MKERPILFSGPMVRAILEGRKTQTRRAVKGVPDNFRFDGYITESTGNLKNQFSWSPSTNHKYNISNGFRAKCPYGQPGDRLWVRETWKHSDWSENGDPLIEYCADGARRWGTPTQAESDVLYERWAVLSEPENYQIDGTAADRKWRPSIFMPRWASRTLLEIVSIRVERLNEISEEDAREEGADLTSFLKLNQIPLSLLGGPGSVISSKPSYRFGFFKLWESINGPGSWNKNPWVWVVEFKRMEKQRGLG